MSEHAMVNRDGYKVPLIGIPPEAVEEVCDCCGQTIQITDTAYVNGMMICIQCQNTGEANP